MYKIFSVDGTGYVLFVDSLKQVDRLRSRPCYPNNGPGQMAQLPPGYFWRVEPTYYHAGLLVSLRRKRLFGSSEVSRFYLFRDWQADPVVVSRVSRGALRCIYAGFPDNYQLCGDYPPKRLEIG